MFMNDIWHVSVYQLSRMYYVLISYFYLLFTLLINIHYYIIFAHMYLKVFNVIIDDKIL